MRFKLGGAFLASTFTVIAFCFFVIYLNDIFARKAFWNYLPARLYLYLAFGFLISGLVLNAITGNFLVGHTKRLIHYIGITSLLGGGLLINIILIAIALIRRHAKIMRPIANGGNAGTGLFANALAAAVLMLLGTILVGINIGLLTEGVADWNPVLKKWNNEIAANARLAVGISGGTLIHMVFIYSFVMGIIILVNNKKQHNDLALVIGVAALCGGGLLVNIVLPIHALRVAGQNKENNNKATQLKIAERPMA